MSKKEVDELAEFRKQLLDAEAPEVKKARKLYDKWVSDFVPLYNLNDTPTQKPKNWEESQIWTRIEGESESWLTNGFQPYDSDDLDFVTGHYFVEVPFTSARLTSHIVSSMDSECSECDGEGEDPEDGEDCLVCDGSGFITTNFDEAYSIANGWMPGPLYVGSVKDLPDPPTSSKAPAVAGQSKFCTECGNKLIASAKFCSDCGTPSS